MKIYVGNLSRRTDDAALREAFAAHGEVNSAEVVREREGNESRGFGFVEMPKTAEGEAAILALNEMPLDGNRLAVNVARPREAGAGGGGNRGGSARRY